MLTSRRMAVLVLVVATAGCGDEPRKQDPLDVTGSWVLDRDALRADSGLDIDGLAERWSRMELIVSADGRWRFRGGFAYDGAEEGTWRVLLDQLLMYRPAPADEPLAEVFDQPLIRARIKDRRLWIPVGPSPEGDGPRVPLRRTD